jgi:hypothetical protein
MIWYGLLMFWEEGFQICSMTSAGNPARKESRFGNRAVFLIEVFIKINGF